MLEDAEKNTGECKISSAVLASPYETAAVKNRKKGFYFNYT